MSNVDADGVYFKSPGDLKVQFFILNLLGAPIVLEKERETYRIRVS